MTLEGTLDFHKKNQLGGKELNMRNWTRLRIFFTKNTPEKEGT